jgi:hypothetical protein
MTESFLGFLLLQSWSTETHEEQTASFPSINQSYLLSSTAITDPIVQMMMMMMMTNVIINSNIFWSIYIFSSDVNLYLLSKQD